MPEFILQIIIVIFAYLLGSIPFSRILVKRTKNIDVLETGSGNTGAMNSYEVTNSRWIGISVFVLDAVKAIIACYFAYLISNTMFNLSLAAVFVIIGHNFNIWLKLKGGRGLASATGVGLFFNPVSTILWCLMWVISYFGVRKNVHVANALATLTLPFLLFLTPPLIADILQIYPYENYYQYALMFTMISIVVFLKHVEPLKKLLKQKKLFSE